MTQESRKATVAQRLYPHTQKRLQNWAKANGLNCAEALEKLIPHAKARRQIGVCNFCQKETVGVRSRHNGHETWCVLWEDKELGR